MQRIDHTRYTVREKIGRALFPCHCVLCRMKSPGRYICRGCESDLPWLDASCERCALPLAKEQSEGIICAACQGSPPLFDSTISPLRYAFPIDCALKGLKFNRQLYYAPAFSAILLPAIRRGFEAVDALVPVPLHRSRHAARGFNQATEICRTITRATGLPVDSSIVRCRNTAPQTGLAVGRRRENLKGAFRAVKSLRCRHPLIVDDVMTTGETCNQLAAELRKAGAVTVGVVTVARAVAAVG